MAHMYRFTHEAVTVVATQDQEELLSTAVPAEISLSSLTMFCAILFMNEFRKVGMDSVDVAKTCNMSEWRRRLYRGAATAGEEDDDIMDLPPKPVSRSGQIYATTSAEETSGKESFNAFLFVHHRPSLAKTIPSTGASGNSTSASPASLSPEAQDLVALKGATHIWLCGSDPEQRRHHLMSKCLDRVEQDVRDWKASGEGSGVLCVHTIPQAFPAMIQFLIKNGFQGGERIIGGENGKVLYWKQVA
ncbi:hypothetical protein EMPS_03694 [Entomortierella parvispora]|uniref:Uncharacterized protein n=1 Tax=Entomortierella parvispora TaxID=205924 RepID=A0A9P3H778_9FUNG|nr:hypothetical protein EMPS_03694 [Entomortierella parvispora]